MGARPISAMNSGPTLLNRGPRPVPGGPGAFAPRRSAGLQPALVVRMKRVNSTGQVVGRHKPVRRSAGLRPPQQTPSQSKPENGFDFPLPLACCGSQSRAPGLRPGRPVPHQAGCQLHPSSLMIHPFHPGNPLPARRAGIFAVFPSQKQFKLRRSGIALPRQVRTGRFLISRLGSGVSGERRMTGRRDPAAARGKLNPRCHRLVAERNVTIPLTDPLPTMNRVGFVSMNGTGLA